ncbi:MAG: phage holin family protein [Propionibacteriaceae bacterium]|jgi:membrane protein implicated in regulation of membrane protease activity|nr:phage holin family protein [Propionibacteriaceae bacterium]
MASKTTQISDLLGQISSDVRSIVADEIALVKAELKPTMRHIGVGSGLFGVAAYFVIAAAFLFWFVLAAGFAWIYSATGLSLLGCVFFGVLTALVVLLIIAAVFALLGKGSFSKAHAPKRTPATVDQAFDALHHGIADGARRVEDELAHDSTLAREQAHPTTQH